jgi:glycosyltransferase involved in cell wall biosynthesis
VVATRVGAIPEVVRHEVTGLLVDRGDAASAADAIVRLAADPELRRRYGCAARLRAEQEFDVKKNVRELLRMFGVSSNGQ